MSEYPHLFGLWHTQAYAGGDEDEFLGVYSTPRRAMRAAAAHELDIIFIWYRSGPGVLSAASIGGSEYRIEPIAINAHLEFHGVESQIRRLLLDRNHPASFTRGEPIKLTVYGKSGRNGLDFDIRRFIDKHTRRRGRDGNPPALTEERLREFATSTGYAYALTPGEVRAKVMDVIDAEYRSPLRLELEPADE